MNTSLLEHLREKHGKIPRPGESAELAHDLEHDSMEINVYDEPGLKAHPAFGYHVHED